MTHLMMQPSRARPYPRIPGPLFTVLAAAFDSSPRVFDLFSEFFHHESYARSFTSKLLAIAKREDGDPWEVRRLATLMLQHQVLLLPPENIEEFDFLFAELGLKASNTPLSKLKDAVFDEGYTTTELRGFIQEFRRKLERYQPVHQQINGARTTERGVQDFIALARQECKLSLARYLFTPEEVVEQILKQVRVSRGKKDMTRPRYPYLEKEAANTFTYLPAYEAAILRILSETAAIYWVSDTTSSAPNSLVEYPLSTVALVIKPPGSDIEIEIKRTGRRGAHPLTAVYRRKGRKVPPCHRLDGACKHSSLLFEAEAASQIAKIFRCVHGREAPVGKTTSIRWIKTVPVGTGEVLIRKYFTDPQFFGEGYHEMRTALEYCVKAYRRRKEKSPLQDPEAMDVTRDFLRWVKPGQTTIVGTSSFRLDALARHLSRRGPHWYFKEGLGVAYTAEDARRLVDEILLETLGVYRPPDLSYQSHEHYVAAAYAIPENRVRSDSIFQSTLREIGTFWGTIRALRGHSHGESFVGRNLGLRSVWYEGHWHVEIIFMDHDKLRIPRTRDADYYPQRVLESMGADERFIFGRHNIDEGASPDECSVFDRPGISMSDIGAVEFLREIYRVDRTVEQQGKAALFEALEQAYRTTQDELVNNPELQSFFHPTFVDRIRDWDTIVRKYLDVAEDPAALASWKEEVRAFLGRKEYEQELIGEHIRAVRKYADFLKRYAFLYRAS